MTISDCIDSITKVKSDLDECTQVPSDVTYQIQDKIDGIIDMLDDAIDNYGDDPVIDDEIEED